jgi:hypothetical protein
MSGLSRARQAFRRALDAQLKRRDQQRDTVIA